MKRFLRSSIKRVICLRENGFPLLVLELFMFVLPHGHASGLA
jgi:hypothetical protein